MKGSVSKVGILYGDVSHMKGEPSETEATASIELACFCRQLGGGEAWVSLRNFEVEVCLGKDVH